MTWERDQAFMKAARLVWRDDVALATSWKRKGRADARRRMYRRYEGWRLLHAIADLRDAAEQAHQELRGGGPS